MRQDAALRRSLMEWYRSHARDLPFRRTRDPYRILVSEVALQQTRVEQGLPFLERFLERFPTLETLASATEDEVLHAWEGLGYYRRARALRAAAQAIVERHAGRVPSSYAELYDLPGVGPYTAGAVASTAFGERVTAVDGNAARVLSRTFLLEDDQGGAAGVRVYSKRALELMGRADPGTFNQALMELGALVCRPRAPSCKECPLRRNCLAFKHDRVADFPPARPRPDLPEVDVAFALVERSGRVLAVRRGRGGLLAGMWGLPGGEMREAESPEQTLVRHLDRLGLRLTQAEELDARRKAFSSRVWKARVYRCQVSGRASGLEHARWFSQDDREKVPFVPFQREILDRVAR